MCPMSLCGQKIEDLLVTYNYHHIETIGFVDETPLVYTT